MRLKHNILKFVINTIIKAMLISISNNIVYYYLIICFKTSEAIKQLQGVLTSIVRYERL